MSFLPGFLYIPFIMMWLFLTCPIGHVVAGETGNGRAPEEAAEDLADNLVDERDLELLANLEFVELLETLQFMELGNSEATNNDNETPAQDKTNEE